MPKKSKEVLSKEAHAKVKQRTEDLLDDDVDVEVDYDDDGLLTQPESKSDKRMQHRRRLELYLEERRLQKELSDDFDF